MGKIFNLLKKTKGKILKYHFCYYKSLVANFKLFPFKEAIHLPLVIYGPTQLKLGRSKIKLNVKPRFGLIKWGYNQDLFVPTKMPSMIMMINGTLIINGPVRVSAGCTFRISGEVNLGKCCRIGGNCKILCNNYVEIGDYSAMAFGSIVCDTNFHYIQYQNSVANCSGSVIIGNLVFIGNNASIVKGAKIPQRAIVSSKSFVNKDFSAAPNGALIAGSPAKVLRDGYYRIFSPNLEKKIQCYFKDNPDQHVYLMSDNDIDMPEDLYEIFL